MLHQCGENTNMANPVTFKAEEHGWTLEKCTINWIDCSQSLLCIEIINEVHMQLVTTDEQTLKQ